jgi:hypothetical protein
MRLTNLILRDRRVDADAEMDRDDPDSITISIRLYDAATGEVLPWRLHRDELVIVCRAAAAACRGEHYERCH